MRLAILGLGLIGGSLGLALRQSRGSKIEVLGWGRRPETAQRAAKRGAIDRAVSLAEAAQAEVVVLAVPILAEREIMVQLAPHLKPGAVVTDVGSTKVQVMAWAQELLPPTVAFVGGHPMAGKEQAGIEAAQADLFQGRTYCLTQAPDAPPQAVERVLEIVQGVGAWPLFLSAADHDFLVAGISHLPLIVASALIAATSQDPAWPQMAKLAASGFRDTTRLASGDPIMGRDLLITNAQNLRRWLDVYRKELERYERLLDDPEALEEELGRVRQVRETWRQQAGYGGG